MTSATSACCQYPLQQKHTLATRSASSGFWLVEQSWVKHVLSLCSIWEVLNIIMSGSRFFPPCQIYINLYTFTKKIIQPGSYSSIMWRIYYSSNLIANVILKQTYLHLSILRAKKHTHFLHLIFALGYCLLFIFAIIPESFAISL